MICFLVRQNYNQHGYFWLTSTARTGSYIGTPISADPLTGGEIQNGSNQFQPYILVHKIVRCQLLVQLTYGRPQMIAAAPQLLSPTFTNTGALVHAATANDIAPRALLPSHIRTQQRCVNISTIYIQSTSWLTISSLHPPIGMNKCGTTDTYRYCLAKYKKRISGILISSCLHLGPDNCSAWRLSVESRIHSEVR